MDPFSGDPHITVAMYCIAVALVGALLLLAQGIVDRQRDPERGARGNKGRHG